MSDPRPARAIVVVAARGDAAAVALVTLLRRRGCHTLLADEHAVVRATLEHRPASGRIEPGRQGTAALAGDVLKLPGGVQLGAATGLLVWRLDGFPVAQLPPEHREYGESEGFAAGLSWLTGLGDLVLNRPDPLGLAGARADLLHLARLAREAGLAVPAFDLRTNDAAVGGREPGFLALDWTPPGIPDPAAAGPAPDGPRLARPVFGIEPFVSEPAALVLDDTVIGPTQPWSTHAGPALAGLARAAGLRCAEIGLGRTRTGRPVVTGISPIPTLRQPSHLAAFADYVERRAGVARGAVAA